MTSPENLPKNFTADGAMLGAKAGQLSTKAPLLRAAGFSQLPRHVFGMDFFGAFLERCGAQRAQERGEAQKDIQRMALNGTFSHDEFTAIERMCARFSPHHALAIRSSAHGDSSGTGVYSSYFSMNSPAKVAVRIRAVLASQFTDDAALFRAGLSLPSGIAVMAEPLVCQPEARAWGENGHVYAPILSGFGFTSGKDGPYIGVVKGLAANYMHDPRLGMAITERQAAAEIDALASDGQNCGSTAALSFANMGHGAFLDFAGRLKSGTLDFPNSPHIHLLDLFEILRNLEGMCQTRQYVEWAAIAPSGTPEFYALQVSDEPLKGEHIAFSPASGSFAHADFVRGGGEFTTPRYAIIDSRNDWGLLRQANTIGEPFHLFIRDSAVVMETLGGFSYRDIQNASAISIYGEWDRVRALDYFGVHFGGRLAMLGKTLLCLSRLDFSPLTSDGQPSSGIFSGGIRTAASEFHQMAQLGKIKP